MMDERHVFWVSDGVLVLSDNKSGLLHFVGSFK